MPRCSYHNLSKVELQLISQIQFLSLSLLKKGRDFTRLENTRELGFKLRKFYNFLLERWVANHNNCLYPSNEQLYFLRRYTGLSLIQIKDWFSNRRRSLKKHQISEHVLSVLPST
ncbi:LAMI_0F00254g1_1 [Lachancea mirantina]|uniref:LAMI_0F00254g1_1 n=1 Tax=Lachancea mirantina TaxID=1230905 RepID=A0A1G4JVI1_9SACH|nr:LAMI_0F00254g1_1 [Lachancea mirantina]